MLSVLLPFYSNIPCFSTFKKLEASIESILDNCRGFKFEILVINDGSHPIYNNIINAKYSSVKNLKVIGLQKNTGLVNALNIGLNSSTGKLIARLDSDDTWIAGKIADQMKFFSDSPDLTLIASGMNIIDSNGKIVSRHGGRGDWSSCYSYARDMGCPFPHSSIVGRKDVFQLLGGYTNIPFYKHCEDYHLWSRWLRFFKVFSLHRTYLNYYDNPAGISSTKSEEQRISSGLVQKSCSSLYMSDAIFGEFTDYLSKRFKAPNEAFLYQFLNYKKWLSGTPISVENGNEFYFMNALMPDRIVLRK